MRDACRDSQLCYNLDRLSVTVSEDEIRQRDAAAGEYPVHRGNGETHVPVFSNILLFFFLHKVVLFVLTLIWSHEF